MALLAGLYILTTRRSLVRECYLPLDTGGAGLHGTFGRLVYPDHPLPGELLRHPADQAVVFGTLGDRYNTVMVGTYVQHCYGKQCGGSTLKLNRIRNTEGRKNDTINTKVIENDKTIGFQF